MTAFAGFYVAPETWTSWLHSNPKRPFWAFGDAAAQDLIEEALRGRNMGAYFCVEEPDYREGACGIMIFRRRRSWRAYIPLRPDSGCDLTGRRILKRYIGLDVSRWKTLWFDEESCKVPHDAKFLKPRVRAERGKVKSTSGNETIDNGDIKTRSATSGEEGEDQCEKESEGAQAEDGKTEDHETQL